MTVTTRKLITVGDSHSMYTFSGIAAETRHLGPVTMHRVGRDGPWLADQVRDVVADDCVIVFCVGEIDVRCHVHRQIVEHGRNEGEVVESLVNGYADALRYCRHPHIAVLAVVPPCRFLDPMHNPEFPFVGTHEDRLRYTRGVNTALRKACHENQWTYVDVSEPYQDSEGFLRRDRSDGCVHIGDTTYVRQVLQNI